jgi:hypothetical protein
MTCRPSSSSSVCAQRKTEDPAAQVSQLDFIKSMRCWVLGLAAQPEDDGRIVNG